MRRRITVLVVAAILALTMAFAMATPSFARQAQTGPQGSGCTTTYQGNSVNSPVVSSHHGSSSSNGSSC